MPNPDENLIRQLYIQVDGTRLEQAVMDELYLVEVDCDLQLPDMAVLCLHDRDARLSSGDTFPLGGELQIGIADAQGRGDHTLFIGLITNLEPSFKPGTLVELTVRAYDRSMRLHRGVHTRTFANMTDSDIASQIAQEAGLQAEVEATSTSHEHVFQDAVSDIAFLRDRARALGYVAYVRDETLHFKPASAAPERTVELEFGRQLRSFHPILAMSEQVNEVEIRGWDVATKREVVGRASSSDAEPEIGLEQTGMDLAKRALGEAQRLLPLQRVSSQSEADARAQTALDELVSTFISAHGVAEGTPELTAGVMVNLSALGARYNGRYRVSSARHVWSTRTDYVTEFRIHGRRGGTLADLLGSAPRREPHASAAIGIVTNCDDPQALGRVRVRFPALNGELETAWARLATPGGGADRGIQLVPEVNDEVLVLFEEGDINRPVVVGGFWNGTDAPPLSGAISNGEVIQRAWVSRTGHKLTMSDASGDAWVRLETAGGHQVQLDDDGNTVRIAASGGTTITIDDTTGNVTIDSQGKVTINATQDMSMETQANLKIKAGANLDIEGTGMVTIKGSRIDLN
ncbi:MAG: VgrG-related protein [Anaerolineae bacterium]|nr:VgrG-related protein [Anaerolineae bacterium]